MAVSNTFTITENVRDWDSSVPLATHTFSITSANYTQKSANQDDTITITPPTLTVKYNTSSPNRNAVSSSLHVWLLNPFDTSHGYDYGYYRSRASLNGGSWMTSLAANTVKTLLHTAASRSPDLTVFFNSNNPTARTVDLLWGITPLGYYTATGTRSADGSDTYMYVGHYNSSTQPRTQLKAGSVTLNTPPTFDNTRLSYNTNYNNPYAGITTASVDISNVTAYYEGYITKAELTIGSQTATLTGDSVNVLKNGTLSILLNAVGTFTPTITVTDSRGQTTTKTLDAITVLGYTAPSVEFTAERTTSTGVDDDEGEYAVIDATFTFTDAAAKLTAPTVTIDGSPATVTWYSTRRSDGTVSGTVNWSTLTSPATVYGRVSVPNIQTSYTVVLTPKDTQSSGTAITQTISSAFYTIDFLAGGHGIAFGKPASDEGFWCDMDAHFNKEAYFKDKANAMRALFDFVYPIGSYYETSDVDFNPNSVWGGTWTLISSKDAYIVDEGTSGIWTYRKWSDGTSECWGRASITLSNYNAYSGFYGYTADFNFPSGLFVAGSVPTHTYTATVDSGFGIAAGGQNTTDTKMRVYALGTAQKSQPCIFDLVAKGKWSNTSEVYYRWHRTA